MAHLVELVSCCQASRPAANDGHAAPSAHLKTAHAIKYVITLSKQHEQFTLSCTFQLEWPWQHQNIFMGLASAA
jgi:hypothetical protein